MIKEHSFWSKIFNLGITEGLNKDDQKKTRLLNIISVAAFPVCLTLVIINGLQQEYLLVGVYSFLALGCLSILMINRLHNYVLGRFCLSIMSMIVFSAAALINQNGAEYFLILNMVATVILFKNTTHIIALSTANAVLFLVIKIIQPYQFFDNGEPQTKLLFNIGWTLLFIILALYYYKTEHLSYHEQIENSNDQLIQQQQQLLVQKGELEQKTNQLEILNHTKEKLFSVIAHDMRTPIAGLKSSLDLYHNKVISKEEFDELSEQLTMQVDNLYSTLDNLLYWSHGQLNGILAKPEKTALKPLALQTISLMLQTARLKQLRIDQKIPETLNVYADPNHIRLVLRNLLSNAIKFSNAQGVIEIEAAQNNGMVALKVKDHGVGMNKTSLNQLFKTETLLTKRGTQNEAGTGLGLALSKEFIDKNNGKIFVESEEGKGSCFTILLRSTA